MRRPRLCSEQQQADEGWVSELSGACRSPPDKKRRGQGSPAPTGHKGATPWTSNDGGTALHRQTSASSVNPETNTNPHQLMIAFFTVRVVVKSGQDVLLPYGLCSYHCLSNLRKRGGHPPESLPPSGLVQQKQELQPPTIFWPVPRTPTLPPTRVSERVLTKWGIQ